MSDEAEHDRPEPAEGVVCSQVSDGAVLLSTEAEIYFGLNETGARIWELLREGQSVDEICRSLGDEYPEVAAEEIRGDVEELLEELAGQGLVRWENGGGSAARDGTGG